MNKSKPGPSTSADRKALAGDSLTSFFMNLKSEGYEGGEIRTYPAHAELFKQDTPAQTVYLVEHGLVKLVRVSSNGSQVIIALRRRQWLIGAPAVLLDKPYSFTAVTLLPSTLRCIPANVFLDLAKTNRQFSSRLHRLLSREIFNHMRNVEAVSCMTAEDRIKRFLRELISEQALSGSKLAAFSLPLTNRELAELIAVTPEHLCRVLKVMERKNLIQRDHGMLVIKDPPGFLRSAAIS